MKGYYPGDEYIDWIGISVYGAQLPDEDVQSFEGILNDSWNEIKSLSSEGKPTAISGMGNCRLPQIQQAIMDRRCHKINSARG